MRVTPAVLPPTLPPVLSRIFGLAPCFAAAFLLAGCAGSSILGEGASAAQAISAPVVPNSGAQTTSVTPLQKFLWVFSPYRPMIQQGNFISQEMLVQLKEGMTRDQVRFVLGTPLLTDIFHANRWDYPFRLARGDGEVTSSRVVVYFEDGKVARFEGGNLPTEKEYIARIAGAAPVLSQSEAAAVAEIETVKTPPPVAAPASTPTATPAAPATPSQ